MLSKRPMPKVVVLTPRGAVASAGTTRSSAVATSATAAATGATMRERRFFISAPFVVRLPAWVPVSDPWRIARSGSSTGPLADGTTADRAALADDRGMRRPASSRLALACAALGVLLAVFGA